MTKDTLINGKKEVSFFAVGDNLIHDSIIDFAQTSSNSYDFTSIYQNVRSDIQNADLSFINQESIIGGDDLALTGYPSFNTPSDMINNLVDTGFDIVGGSNNHSLDRGTKGIENTLAYWQKHEDNVLFTGVFNSQEHRDEIPIVEVNGIRFSVLAYTYGTNGIQPEFPYLVNYFDKDLIADDIKRAKKTSDFIIFSAHWGDEHSLAPNEMQKDYAQFLADEEVDLIVGTHSHTIQPVEWLTGVNGNESLVIYSLGNFVAASKSDINMLGGSISLDIIKENNELYIDHVYFEPLVIHYDTPNKGDIENRTNFEVFKLEEYTKDKAKEHALNDFEDNLVSPELYQEIVEEVIDKKFLK